MNKYIISSDVRISEKSVTADSLDFHGNRDWKKPTIEALFHENAKLSEARYDGWQKPIGQFSSQSMSVVNKIKKPDYPHNEAIDLPKPTRIEIESLSKILKQRESRLSGADEPLTLSRLSAVLSVALGAFERGEIELEGEHDQDTAWYRRPYPSPGGLYPIETYVVATSVDGLESGVYYYVPEDHILRVVDRWDDNRRASSLFFDNGKVEDADAALCMTCAIARATAKYGTRGFRFALIEAGHVGQNVQLAATAAGIAALPYGGYNDYKMDDAFGIDGFNESVVATTLLRGAVEDTSQEDK